MKKKLNIIVLLSLIVLTLFTFGCKKEVELGDIEDTAKWNNMQSLGGGVQNQLVIEANDYNIDWWIITDMKGIVFEDYTSTSSEKSIPKGSEVTLTFNVKENTNLVLWIAQKDRVPKAKGEGGSNLPAGSKDFKGKIIVSPSQGYKVSDSGYREENSPVGVVKLTCNETAAGNKKDNCTSGNWTGNYRITEIWPLSNKNGPQWEATEGLKFYLEGDNVVEEGESIKVIYPAGNSIFAIKQPDRFAENPTEEKEIEAKAKQANWYWCASFYDQDIADDLIDDDEGSTFTVKNYGSVKAHDEIEAKSNECGAYFKLSNNNEGTMYKSALGTTYIIDEADIVDGSSEK